MATLYVTEFARLSDAQDRPAPIADQSSLLAQQAVSFTTSTQSAAFNANTRFVRVQADGDCHVLFGADPTATTSHMPMTAGQAEYFGVVKGSKVAAIEAA